jgi:D-glycero-alpha-D-manno-heptose-7-phosphate kinase
MIITRTPLRLPLGGGGTDLPAYSSRYGGFLLSAAINRYVYVIVNQRFEESIRVSCSLTEVVERVAEIQNPTVREALKLLKLDGGLEIVSTADLPANTGLGSASSFTVGLLNALLAYKRETVDAQTLAEDAFHIEADILGEPIGKHDSYISAFGGITCLDINPDGRVLSRPLLLSKHVVDKLQDSLVFFYTGVRRNATEVLNEEGQALSRGEEGVTSGMHAIKEIGKEIKLALERGDLRRFGELMNEHWQVKKHLSPRMTSSDVDRWYEIARVNGAVGGKIMGAGEGSFFVFYCENANDKLALRKALTGEGLKEVNIAFDFEGSKVVVNL